MRHHKPDRAVTRMMLREGYFKDKRSFVALPEDDGESHVYLKGEDIWDRRYEVATRDNFQCQASGCVRHLGIEDGHLHHVVHRGKGGSDDIANLVWFCPHHHAMHHVRPKFGHGRQEATEQFSKLYKEST